MPLKRSEKICRLFRKATRPFHWSAYVWFLSLFALAAFAACGTRDGQQIRTESDNRLILFVFSGKAETVCLSGDFNDWSPDCNCLRKDGERWEIQILLPPGRYRYGFLLDGKDWIPYPGSLFQEEDGFGRKNSILVVE